MMNWITMTSCSEAELEYLRGEIAEKRSLVFDGVVMPGDCGGEICSIRFVQHDTGAITLYCQPAPDYTGSDPRIQAWCSSGCLTFRDFLALARFLRSFSAGTPAGAAPATVPEAPPTPRRPTLQVDRARLDPNSEAAQGTPGFIAIEPARLQEALAAHVLGQPDALAKIAHLTAVHLGQRRRKRPLSLLLWGPTGVGKTESCLNLPEALNELTEGAYGFHLEVVDCTQLEEAHATARLTGPPPGYVGYGEPCIWDCIRDYPRTVFVFNELEKAHPKVMQVLMEAVDTGKQQAGKVDEGGKRHYDLTECLFLFTSNLDLTPRSRAGIDFRTVPPPAEQAPIPSGVSTMRRIIQDNESARNALLDQQVYPPEVVGRFTAFIQFRPLSGQAVMDLVIQKLSQTAYDQHALCLTNASAALVQSVYNLCAPQVPKAGVRVIQRVIDTYLGEAFMRCSHQNPEYAQVALEGTLEDPVLVRGRRKCPPAT